MQDNLFSFLYWEVGKAVALKNGNFIALDCVSLALIDVTSSIDHFFFDKYCYSSYEAFRQLSLARNG